MIKSICVKPKALALCFVKARLAADLTREETQSLMHWCDSQTEALWDNMSLQEILNVYRISAESVTWEMWAEDEPENARVAWNRAVISPGNRMRPI